MFGQSSELQKRALDSSSHHAQSSAAVRLSSMRINHLNLETSNSPLILPAGSKTPTSYQKAMVITNSNNKSSKTINSTSLNDYLNQQQQQQQQFRVSKNLIDLNLQLPPQALSPQLQQQTQPTPQQQQTTQLIRTQSGKAQNNAVTSNQKLANESHKFLEDILANGKRSSNGRNSATGVLTGSLQLPTTITIINRSNEERSLFPDKLILERYKSTILTVISY